MKNKKFTIGLVLLIAGSMAFTSCTKGKTNTAPEPDKEIASSADRAMVELVASDMGEMAAQGLDGGAAVFVGSVTPMGSFPQRTITLNNTMGWDGRMRTGTFDFDESTSFPGATFYRNPGYVATCTVSNYVVDNYTVVVNNFKVENTTAQGWTIGKDLTWTHTYNFTVKKPDGTSFTYDGKENKILSGYVYGPSSNTLAVIQGTAATVNSINWQLATNVGFYGDAKGTTADGQSYTSTVTQDKMLVRNYQCAPEKMFPASINSRNERHPFIKGIMTMKLSGKGDRTIDFGDGACDYNIKVTIDGITYQEDVN